MPGFLLHVNATVLCQHGGQAHATIPNNRVVLRGQPTVQQANAWTVAACPFTTGSNPMPCVTAQWISAATRVLSNGVPLLLQDSQATCTPNGTGVTVITTQVRVKGV